MLQTDVADPEQVEKAAAAVEAAFGPIDIWVNNAMCSVFSPVKEMTPADYKRVTEVTYLGFVYGSLAALKCMLPRDRGIIVQVGSALAYRSIPLQSAYCAAKHAIAGFTNSLRCELLHDKSNVKITMVQMPAMNTPQFDWVKNRLPRNPQPVPPIYQPEVAADAIVYAAHHYRREWFVGWPTVVAIQGNKVAPSLGDWYLAQQGYGANSMTDMRTPTGPITSMSRSMSTSITGRTGFLTAERTPTVCNSGWTSTASGSPWPASQAGCTTGLQNGLGKCWRGGIIGLSLGALSALALAVLSQSRTLDHVASRKTGEGPAQGHTGTAVGEGVSEQTMGVRR